MHESRKKPILTLELIAGFTMGLLAVTCFLFQALTLKSSTTQQEVVLFNLLQFLLTVGFTWFSTRAISRREFEQSLKRFAISAYRRIADIERMITRLHSQLRGMILESSPNHHFLVVEAIVSDTIQIVRSSAADWSDVIGDELLALENIKRLEHEKAEREASLAGPEAHGDLELKKLNEKIAQLESMLPIRLQVARPAESTFRDYFAARWLASQHAKQRGLMMEVKTGEEYPHDRDHETLKPGEILHTVKQSDGAIDVADGSGAGIGRLTNCTPMSYDDFARSFEECYGSSVVSLEYLGLPRASTAPDGAWEAWFAVRVVQQPSVKRKTKSK